MPEMTEKQSGLSSEWVRYQGRGAQIMIYLRKFLRMFIYQNDWKVLPMAAVIAGLLALVIRDSFFLTMEGTLTGAFALTSVSIWNGCFNSIQVICRERDVIKREHRSGLHISAYIAAHLIYQSVLCLLQTVITVGVFYLIGIKFPEKGMFTRWMIADIGFTVFFVTLASDALSLWISSLARNTTAAMTIMPFILIFQLVFSGGMMALPEWSRPISDVTISQYGLKALNAQADYNELPLVSLWWTLVGIRDSEVTATFTVGQAADYLADENNPGAADLRNIRISQTVTLRELADRLSRTEAGGSQEALLAGRALLARWGDEEFTFSFTLGELLDRLTENTVVQGERDQSIEIHTTIGQILDRIGERRVYRMIQETAGVANQNPNYEYSRKNVATCWAVLLGITLTCTALATVTLEFIDKDKR